MVVLFCLDDGHNSCSRSQCIINIRCGSKQASEEVDVSASSTVLTIVDLAGAEREKKTGNQVYCYFSWEIPFKCCIFVNN